MNYLSAWAAYTGSVNDWLKSLMESGEVDEHSTVWGGADGSYAVGDDYDPETFEEETTDYVDRGTVGEWLD